MVVVFVRSESNRIAACLQKRNLRKPLDSSVLPFPEGRQNRRVDGDRHDSGVGGHETVAPLVVLRRVSVPGLVGFARVLAVRRVGVPGPDGPVGPADRSAAPEQTGAILPGASTTKSHRIPGGGCGGGSGHAAGLRKFPQPQQCCRKEG